MINSIIAFSDIHIRTLKRHDEFKEQFKKLIIEIKNKKPDRVVIAGDLFHSKIIVTNEMISILAKLLNGIAKFSKVIIIPGNHDTIIDSPRLDSITPIIEMLNNDNIVYYKESGCFIDKWDNDLVWAVWSCLENQKNPDIKEFKRENPNKNYVGLYHGVVNGFSTDVGFIFNDEGIDVNEFSDCDVVITGDIHKHQVLKTDNNVSVFSCSSLIQQDFGESLNNHGFIDLKFKNNKWSFELVEVPTDYGFFTFELNNIENLVNI
jgi:DNA repair exonuclease SbcCD nuclease subunit